MLGAKGTYMIYTCIYIQLRYICMYIYIQMRYIYMYIYIQLRPKKNCPCSTEHFMKSFHSQPIPEFISFQVGTGIHFLEKYRIVLQ